MTSRFIKYGPDRIYYKVILNSNLDEKIRIHVYPNQVVEVEAPEDEQFENIDRAVTQRARWITKQLDEAKAFRAHVLPREYINGETHFYLGRRHKLKMIDDQEMPQGVKLTRGILQINVRTNNPSIVKRSLENWYIERASTFISHRLNQVAEKSSWIISTPAMKLVVMRKQWGSLSPNGVVHINPWLIRAPVDCIDYVLCHELCHFIERNHGKNFYRLLKLRVPNWEHTKLKLDGMAELLLAN